MTKHRYKSNIYKHRTVSGSFNCAWSQSGIDSVGRALLSNNALCTINKFNWSYVNGSSKSVSGTTVSCTVKHHDF